MNIDDNPDAIRPTPPAPPPALPSAPPSESTEVDPDAPLVARIVDAALETYGVIHRRDLKKLGVRRGRYRGLLEQGYLRPADDAADVFVVGAAPPSWEQALTVGVLQLGEDALVGGRSAAALHRFDTFKPGVYEYLTAPEHRRRMVKGRVRSSWAPLVPEDRDQVRGIPCTSPARTIFDLASLVTVARLEHAIDSALRDGSATEADLLEVLGRLRVSGRSGVRKLEQALAIADGPAAHSVLERRFLRLMAAHRLSQPRSQVTFVDEDQQFVARVDFLFGEVLVVEVEGHRFHATRAQRRRDNERRNALERQHRHVLVFTYEDVRDRPAYVAREVRAALAAFERRPGAA